MNILLTLILLSNVVIVAIFLYYGLKFRNIYRDIVSFITPIDEKTPSPLANVASVVADMFSRSICASIKSTFMGKQSAEVRQNAGIEADIAEGMLSATNPAIGAILNSFPALKKTLRRNPGLMDLALSKLIPKIQSAPSTEVGQPSNGQVKFKLGRG